MTDPSAQDLRNEATRDAISARMEAEYRQVLAWAHQIMDKGWLPNGRHFLIDKQEEDDARREGRHPTAAATCYSVSNGARQRHFIVRDDQPIEVSGYIEAFGDMLNEPHPTMRIEVKGQLVAPGRYSLCWAPIELYEPRTAEQLAGDRERRENRAIEKAAEENPLFADMIKSGELKPRKKSR